MYCHNTIIVEGKMYYLLASFPGSPSFRAIIPRMTFDPPEGKRVSKVIRGIIARKEGEPGNEATICNHHRPVTTCEQFQQNQKPQEHVSIHVIHTLYIVHVCICTVCTGKSCPDQTEILQS